MKEINEYKLIISARDYSGLREMVEKELNVSLDALESSERYLNISRLNYANVVKYYPKVQSYETIFRIQAEKSNSSSAVSKSVSKINDRTSKYQPDVSMVM